jgi:hypothetical protein
MPLPPPLLPLPPLLLLLLLLLLLPPPPPSLLLLLLLLLLHRDDNAVADKLSNIAMDTDLVVDQIPKLQAGTTRRQMAAAFLTACDMGPGSPAYDQ